MAFDLIRTAGTEAQEAQAWNRRLLGAVQSGHLGGLSVSPRVYQFTQIQQGKTSTVAEQSTFPPSPGDAPF